MIWRTSFCNTVAGGRSEITVFNRQSPTPGARHVHRYIFFSLVTNRTERDRTVFNYFRRYSLRREFKIILPPPPQKKSVTNVSVRRLNHLKGTDEWREKLEFRRDIAEYVNNNRLFVRA